MRTISTRTDERNEEEEEEEEEVMGKRKGKRGANMRQRFGILWTMMLTGREGGEAGADKFPGGGAPRSADRDTSRSSAVLITFLRRGGGEMPWKFAYAPFAFL